MNEKILLTGFDQKHKPEWAIANDGVMGGLSSGRMDYQPGGQALFSGIVSLENNGGFASCRMKLNTPIPPGCSFISLRVKGDGKKYKFRIRTDSNRDGIAYSADFSTENDTWMVIELPIAEFTPTFRGCTLNQVPPLDVTQISQIGLLIADQQSGQFSLEVDWIKSF